MSDLFKSLVQHPHFISGELRHLQEMVQGVASESDDGRLFHLITICVSSGKLKSSQDQNQMSRMNKGKITD